MSSSTSLPTVTLLLLTRDPSSDAHLSPGLLSPILDPLGRGLGTVLRPVGAVVEVVTKPVANSVGSIIRPVAGPLVGEHEEKMEILGGGNKDSYVHKKESIGGKVQDAENPLGLDQTGRWGFREEEAEEEEQQ